MPSSLVRSNPMTKNDLQKTLVLLKPDALERGIVGEVITRFEKAGYKIVAMKMVLINQAFCRTHYANVIDKPYYQVLEDLMISGPVVAMVWEGQLAVAGIRKLVGFRKPEEADPGTIRGDFAHYVGDIHARNIVHASGNPEEATTEIALWFKDEEIHSYRRADEKQLWG